MAQCLGESTHDYRSCRNGRRQMLVSREELEHLVDLAKRKRASRPADRFRRDTNCGPYATNGKRRLLRFLGGPGRRYLFSHRWRANLMSLLLSRGDVVLTPFPFTDLTQRSLRLLWWFRMVPIGDDLVLAGISSVIRGSRVPTDLLIDRSHAEFKQTGLRVASVSRLHKLATVENRILVRRLGQIGASITGGSGCLVAKGSGFMNGEHPTANGTNRSARMNVTIPHAAMMPIRQPTCASDFPLQHDFPKSGR